MGTFYGVLQSTPGGSTEGTIKSNTGDEREGAYGVLQSTPGGSTEGTIKSNTRGEREGCLKKGTVHGVAQTTRTFCYKTTKPSNPHRQKVPMGFYKDVQEVREGLIKSKVAMPECARLLGWGEGGGGYRGGVVKRGEKGVVRWFAFLPSTMIDMPMGFYKAHQEVRPKEPSNPTPEMREKVPMGFYKAHQEVRPKEPSNPTPEMREKVPMGFYKAHQEVRPKEPSNPTPEVREKVPEERDSPWCRTNH